MIDKLILFVFTKMNNKTVNTSTISKWFGNLFSINSSKVHIDNSSILASGPPSPDIISSVEQNSLETPSPDTAIHNMEKDAVLLPEQPCTHVLDMVDEETDCCICLSLFTEPMIYKTKCNHTTCVDCIVKLYELKNNSIKCPICRTSLYDESFCTFIKSHRSKKKKRDLPPIDPSKYPVEVDWSFHTNIPTRIMIQSAYEAVQCLEKWEFLYQFEVDEDTGFMLSRDPEIEIIIHAVDEFYQHGHSGSSIGITMRHIHFIAKYGLEEYRTLMQTP